MEIESTYDVIKKHIKVNIKDTGVGIKAEDRKKLFQRFGKLRDS